MVTEIPMGESGINQDSQSILTGLTTCTYSRVNVRLLLLTKNSDYGKQISISKLICVTKFQESIQFIYLAIHDQ